MKTLMATSAGRLWLDGPDGYIYLPTVVVWRMMWGGGKERAILKGRAEGRQFIQNFPEDCNLEIHYGILRDPSIWHEEHRTYRLVDCRTRRAWIFPMAMTPNEACALDAWLEVSCKIEKLR